MADTLTARTALGGDDAAALRTHGDPAVVTLRELPAAAMIDLRFDPSNAAVLDSVHGALALKLPLAPGKTSAHPDRAALWLGPDQWLIVAPPGTAASLVQALGDAVSAVDVSDLRAELELAGPRAVDVLRKGCAIDLHPRAFAAGDCALTMLGRVRVALRQIDDRPGYRLLVERSVALYLWDSLTDAMIEYTAA